MKISVISGGFDPLHSGHIAYIQSASKEGERLIICLNSDNWLENKKGKCFLPFKERKLILENLVGVDEVIDFEDDEFGSAINGILAVQKKYPEDEIVFCNGGDRNDGNIPEMSIEGINFLFSIGGDDKKNSSSSILKEWNLESENRIWGKFHNLHQDQNVKVKELIVQPGKGMSFQRHFYRSEIWLVSKGKCLVNYSKNEPENSNEIILDTHDHLIIETKDWHQITNPYDIPCHIIEIQYGPKTEEEDIERLYYFDEKK